MFSHPTGVLRVLRVFAVKLGYRGTDVTIDLSVVQLVFCNFAFWAVTIRNPTNGALRGSVQVLPSAGWKADYPTQFDCAANEKAEVPVRIHVPKDHLPGDYAHGVRFETSRGVIATEARIAIPPDVVTR